MSQFKNLSFYLPEPVVVSELPAEVGANVGYSASVVCSAYGTPTPSITWTKDGSQLATSNVVISTITVNNTYVESTLTIQVASTADHGQYTCEASNQLPNGTVTQSSTFTFSTGRKYDVITYTL